MKLHLTFTQQENFKHLIGYYGNSVDMTLKALPYLDMDFTCRDDIEEFFEATTTVQDFTSEELINYIIDMNILTSHQLLVTLAKHLHLIRKPAKVTDERRLKFKALLEQVKANHLTKD